MYNLKAEQIKKGLRCPYCDQATEFVDSKVIYGKSYGMVFLCKDCDAYVGTHKATGKALGRLANGELRFYKQEAHKYFDALWRKKMKICGSSKRFARNRAYKWLSDNLKIDFNDTHIGMFDVELCRKTIELCQPFCVT